MGLAVQASTSTTVLHIDDNEAHRTYWSGVLKNFSSNYIVLEASDGMSGVVICRNRAVDCVLLDLDMPESGFKTLLELIPNRKRPQVAVVILTHLIHPFLRDMAKDNGAQGWLVKQHTSADELHTTIQQAVTVVKSIQ